MRGLDSETRHGRCADERRGAGTAAHAGLGMVVVMTGVLITAVETTIVVLALPEIERSVAAAAGRRAEVVAAAG